MSLFLLEMSYKVVNIEILGHGSAKVDRVSKILAAVHEIRSFSEPLRPSSRPSTRAQPSTMNLVAALSRSLATDIAWTCRRLNHKLLYLFKILLSLWPQLVLFFRVLRSIPWSVTLLLEDNINFEDALGDLHSLPFQYFKHWDIFERMLQHQFQSKPGHAKVAEGKYRLFRGKEATFDLNAKNWDAFIRPGMSIPMSLKISSLGRGPRICAYYTRTTNGEEVSWSYYEFFDKDFSELNWRSVAKASQKTAFQEKTTEEGLCLRASKWETFKRIELWVETLAAERDDQEQPFQAADDDTTSVQRDVESQRPGDGAGGGAWAGSTWCCAWGDGPYYLYGGCQSCGYVSRCCAG